MTRVLLVDDNVQLREALAERLAFLDGLVVVGAAADGKEAVRLTGELLPDVVIMDIQMPGMDGIEATRLIRQMHPSCQIVAHTAFEDSGLVSEMIRAGAKAYLLKGGQPDELTRAIESVTAGESLLAPQAARPLLDDLETLYHREQERTKDLEEMVAQLRELTVTDYLTGLANHRDFQERLGDQLAEAAARQSRLALVLIDLDDFHLVNNRFSHAVGDSVLKEVAERISAICRPEDAKARVGGEEFAVVLRDMEPASVLDVAGRILDAIRSRPFASAGEVTASVGMALHPEHSGEKDELVQRAESALRVAKSRGKDCTVAWSPELEPSSAEKISREAQLRSIFALARAVDARDPHTGLHSQRLARYARAFATGLGIDDERLAVIRAAALLHDVGKIGVRDAILLKPTMLDDVEFSEMREHPVLGERIVTGAVDHQISRAVRHHHERIDGDGYPDGLKGDDIPLASRILFVADAFDAMTSDRVYRKALSVDKAVNELKRCAGTQFDPEVVTSATSLIESGVVKVLD
jgi:diguanylate cyclase (GGDEF)-like protein